MSITCEIIVKRRRGGQGCGAGFQYASRLRVSAQNSSVYEVLSMALT